MNRVYPRFHSEPHDWAMVPVVTPITGASYLAEDGRVIAKQLDYEGVTQVNQACQLAAYDLANSREGIVATLPCKLTAANYRVGDCITVDVDVANLTNLKMVVIKRSPDYQSGGFTLTCRSETDAKHPFAMGESGIAPPTPTITGVDPSYVGAPLPDFWATRILEQTDAATGESRSVISVIGSAGDSVYAQTVMLRWRLASLVDGVITPAPGAQWTFESFPASQGNYQIVANPGTYDVQIAYVNIGGAAPASDAGWLDLGVETVGGSTAANTANVGGMTAAEVTAALLALTGSADATTQAETVAANLEAEGDALVSAALQSASALLAQHASTFTPKGLPVGPFLENTAAQSSTAISTLAIMGEVLGDGFGFLLSQSGVYYDGQTTLVQKLDQLSSATGAVSADLSQNYLTATSTTQAIATASLSLQAYVDNGVGANLADNYLTSTQTTGAITTAIATNNLTLTSTIEGSVNSNLTSNYYTASTTDGKISTAVSAAGLSLTSTIEGSVNANLTSNYYTATTTDGRISTAISNYNLVMESYVGGGVGAQVTGLQSDLSTNYLTSASAMAAISSATTNLSVSNSGTLGAFVTTQATALQSTQGALSGTLALSVGAGGSVTSLNLISTNAGVTGASSLSEVLISCADFVLTDQKGVPLFGISASGAYIGTSLDVAGNLNVKGALLNGALGAGAVTNDFFAFVIPASVTTVTANSTSGYAPPSSGSTGGGAVGGGGSGGMRE